MKAKAVCAACWVKSIFVQPILLNMDSKQADRAARWPYATAF